MESPHRFSLPAPRKFIYTILSPFTLLTGAVSVPASPSTTRFRQSQLSTRVARSPRSFPNLWQDNFVTGNFPLVFQPVTTALPGIPVPFHNTAVPLALPPAYNINGQLLFPNGNSSNVPANTQIDLPSFQKDLAALTPGDQTQLLTASVISREFSKRVYCHVHAGCRSTNRQSKIKSSHMWVRRVSILRVFSRRTAMQAPIPHMRAFTQFNSSGNAIGGFGPEMSHETGSHSDYNALQASFSQTTSRIGLSYQASYTFSKSIDDTSAVLGGLPANAGVISANPAARSPSSQADKGLLRLTSPMSFR